MQRMMWVIAMVAALGVGPATAGQAPPSIPPSGAADAQGVVDVNSATMVQLETLPGVGPRTAERIVDYRRDQGGFKKIEELMNVRGIGERSFLKVRPLVTVGPSAVDAGEGR